MPRRHGSTSAHASCATRTSDLRVTLVARAPGRVNLIGEHTDYNEGFVLPVGIQLGIAIALVPTDDRRVEVTLAATGERAAFDLDAIGPKTGSWIDYIAGMAWALAEAGVATRGFRGVLASDLPQGSGLSSSAALELASSLALVGGAMPPLDRMTLAQTAQRAENRYVGVQSGLMDQFASSCGAAGAALLLDCRSTEWRPVAIPDGLALVVCNTGSPRRLGSSEYNIRRAQCEEAVAGIRRVDPTVRTLRDVTPALLAAARPGLDPVVARRAEHVVAENDRVLATLAAFEAGDVHAIGEAFGASHASLRDLFEVSSPQLDALVEIASAVPGVVAARMTGAGFGGCTVNLVEADAIGALREAVLAGYPARSGLSPMILPVAAADGAGAII